MTVCFCRIPMLCNAYCIVVNAYCATVSQSSSETIFDLLSFEMLLDSFSIQNTQGIYTIQIVSIVSNESGEELTVLIIYLFCCCNKTNEHIFSFNIHIFMVLFVGLFSNTYLARFFFCAY